MIRGGHRSRRREAVEVPRSYERGYEKYFKLTHYRQRRLLVIKG
jgi:hypothetical protein